MDSTVVDKPDIAYQRLYHQGLEPPTFKTPSEVMTSLGAVQAQDYAGAKWSVAQRLGPPLTDNALDKAFADGTILRTHVLRPTWHFVSPEDIRWLLKLTAPRVHAVNAYMYRQLELDEAVFKRSTDAIIGALAGDRHLTRKELGAVLEQAGITATGQRLAALMMYAELEAIICSGSRRGKQFTYALLEERVPPAKTLTREEALAELVRRYFSSRSPATSQDFVWWSGLSIQDAKVGMEAVKADFEQATVEDRTYWLSNQGTSVPASQQTAYLLPSFDEYLLSYKDRSASANEDYAELWAKGNTFVSPIILNGRTVGCWRRDLKKDSVTLTLHFFRAINQAERSLIAEAAERYGTFLEKRVEIS